MKKVILWLILAFCLIPAAALCEEAFVLQENVVLSGMDTSWYQGYEPVVNGDALAIHLPIKSEASNGKLTATLVMDDPEVSPIKSQKLSHVFWRNEGMFSVALNFRLSSKPVNGDYSGRVVLTGDDRDGRDLRSEYPVVIRIRNGEKEAGLHPAIENVTGTLKVGEDGKIAARITNPSRCAEMRDLLLTVTDASGDILPGGSDTMKLEDLRPGQSVEIRYPVLVKPSAGVALHQLKFKLTYTAAGTDGVWEETFTVPVTQEIRIEQGGVQMAGSVVQGDMASLTLPLMNMGRGDLRNVVATLALPGITDRQSVLVGIIAPGETKQAKLSFTPGKSVLGEVAGEVTVTCEDEWGNQTSFSVPASITVEEPVVMEKASVAEEAQEKTPYLIYILSGGCALLLIALILQGALLRRRIHRLEEDRL